MKILYNLFLEIMWQLCAIYNFLRAYFLIFFPKKIPNRIEPPEDKEWFLLCYIASDGVTLIEEYYDTFKDANNAYSMISHYKTQILFLYNYSINGERLTFVRKGKPIDVSNLPKKSKKEIIYAEYRHPKMKEPIFFTDIARYNLVGNELFTSEFVLRYLEYNCPGGYYHFDQNYSITIMDNEMNIYSEPLIL